MGPRAHRLFLSLFCQAGSQEKGAPKEEAHFYPLWSRAPLTQSGAEPGSFPQGQHFALLPREARDTVHTHPSLLLIPCLRSLAFVMQWASSGDKEPWLGQDWRVAGWHSPCPFLCECQPFCGALGRTVHSSVCGGGLALGDRESPQWSMRMSDWKKQVSRGINFTRLGAGHGTHVLSI